MTQPRPAEFDAQVVACLPRLERYALRFVRGDRCAAEDLAQEAVAKALRNHSRFEAGTNMSAWLQTILRNHFLSQARKRGREVEDVEGLHAGAVAVPGGQDSRMEYAETMERMRLMPGQLRRALLMVAEEGLSYEEVAERMGIALGTVKSRVNRARAFLEGEDTLPVLLEAPEPLAEPSLDRVRELFMRGRVVSEIAEALGVPGHAVVAEVARLGLSRKRKAAVARAA